MCWGEGRFELITLIMTDLFKYREIRQVTIKYHFNNFHLLISAKFDRFLIKIAPSYTPSVSTLLDPPLGQQPMNISNQIG